MEKQIISFDFDGVIHSYKSGWQGAEVIPDPIVPGIDKVINDLREAGYYIVVVTTRCSYSAARAAIRKYLEDNNIQVDGITSIKEPCLVHIDDRTICFNGQTDGLVEQIKNFKPWHK